MSKPTISVVISTLNAENDLAECLDSIVQQSKDDIELVVVDGCSSDGTTDVIKSYEKYLTHWHSRKDNGIYDAWNGALDYVMADWVLFLGADDRLVQADVLRTAADLLKAVPADSPFVYGSINVVGNQGQLLGQLGSPWSIANESISYEMSVPHTAVFHRRAFFERFGRFDFNFQVAGDHELLLRWLHHTNAPPVFLPDIIITNMRAGGVSAHPHHRMRTIRERMVVTRKYGYRGYICRAAVSFMKAVGMNLIYSIVGEDRYNKMWDERRARRMRNA